MAKIEFSKEELSILKEASDLYKKGGAQEVKDLIEKKGLNIEVSPDVRALDVPELDVNGSDGCYGCVACLVIFALMALAYAK